MKRLSEREAVKLLKKHACDDDAFKGVLGHAKAVRKFAKEIGDNVKGVDLDFIETASLLHDIGRFKCRPGSKNAIKHGVVGGEMLRDEGYEEYALVAERHLGPGISKEDVLEQGLDLPARDYIPISKEEKIIAYADNLIFGERRGTVEEAVERFGNELGKKVGKRVKKLADEVEEMKR